MDDILSKDYSGFGLSPTEILLFIHLNFRSDSDGYCDLTTSDLALICCCSRPLISRSLSSLSSAGLIEIISPSKIGDSNRYLVRPGQLPRPKISPKKKIVSNSKNKVFQRESETSFLFDGESPEEVERLNQIAFETSMNRIMRKKTFPANLSPAQPSESKRSKARSNRKKKKKR